MNEAIERFAGDHITHRKYQERERQHGADPEPARHVIELARVLFK